jgi:hypothetical protein
MIFFRHLPNRIGLASLAAAGVFWFTPALIERWIAGCKSGFARRLCTRRIKRIEGAGAFRQKSKVLS